MNMSTGDWAIVFATLMGPILAVQAQKYLEGLREHRNSKLWVFRSLMTTRMQRLSVDHVRALNMIDISFYGRRFFFWRWQTAAEKRVISAWETYLDNLATDTNEWPESRLHVHFSERARQFNALMVAIGNSVDYNFDEIHIKKTGYIPVAHNDLEAKQQQLLDSAVGVLQGRQAIKMDVSSFPTNPEVAASYQKMIGQFVAITEGGTLKISKDEPAA
ncbi:MAG: hypothetical protein Q8M91_08425 [Polaromonas sp.]|nr:hypothetical protein [Polaromonas sp.]